MSLAVIGHTGFVGGTLCKQAPVTETYNSQNIEAIRGRSFENVICAGAPGAKWKANQDGPADLDNLRRLIANIRQVHADRFVLISTVDVYESPCQVDEETVIPGWMREPYGGHRYYLELSVREMFADALIVRLPGLFGPGLKKNFIYDLMHGNTLHLTHYASTFQFYDMGNLWADICQAMTAGLYLINLATEPVKAGDVAQHCFGIDFRNETTKPAVHYDMRTRHGAAFGRTGPYLYSADYTLEQITVFAGCTQRRAI
ncbi:MAG: NAD-dependent epimerase/dehydratase family protein [Bryobacteraceae bacterium]